MSDFACVFPGQGSQSIGMLSELANAFPIVQETFKEASNVLEQDLWQMASTGPQDKLNQTQWTQPVLLAASYAIWRIWQNEIGKMPKVMAGHSLGEYSALVCAQAIEFSDALKLVHERGRLMQLAVPEGEGAMAAILGLDNEKLAELCQQAAQGGVVQPVNFNAKGQTVIAGSKEPVERAIVLCKEAGAKRAISLPVSVPSHCALMQDAAMQLGEVLEKTPIQSPIIPIVHNFDAQMHSHPDDIRSVLMSQLHHPVLWVDTMLHIQSMGLQTIWEIGPGKVLSGLAKRIDRSLNCVAIEGVAQLSQAKSFLLEMS